MIASQAAEGYFIDHHLQNCERLDQIRLNVVNPKLGNDRIRV